MSISRARAPQLHAQTVPRSHLAPALIDRMWTLFSAHYADVDRTAFEADLAGKDDVVLLRSPADDELQGFSTLQRLHLTLAGRPVRVLFTGDTIVAPAYWGQTALQRAFLAYAIGWWLRQPTVPLWWFLITKGYKTYLLLTRNFPVHWPRHDRPTPPDALLLLDACARAKFPETWVPERGILAHAGRYGRLREEVAPIDARLAAAPDVRFFLERNPGHAAGDELVCLGRIGPDLWTFYMTKLLRRTLSRRRRPGGGQ
ncbi:MAG: hypothetical protein RBU45_09810 [Myxococcota bacterium]|nr:hypothetical protein [Myxococcota bacterium]